MSLLAELFGLALYLTQQAGILLGVGAELVLLVSYLLHVHARNSGPTRFVVPARFVERLGLGLIVLSGFGVVFYHVLLWQVAILFAPAFIAKWILIGAVLIGYQIEQRAEERAYPWRSVVHGFIGGTWLALFLLNMLAPDTSMVFLVEGYGAWMAFFAVIWGGFVTALSPNAMVTKFAATASRPALATATPAAAPTAPTQQPAKQPKQTPAFSMSTVALPKVPIPLIPTIALPKIAMPTLPKISLPKIPLPAKMPTPAPAAPKAPLPSVYHIELEAPKQVMPAPAPRHIDPAPAPRKPVVAAAPAPKPTVAPAPAPSPTSDGLPRVWVMPRSPGV